MREILRYYLEIRDLKDLKKVNAPNKDVAFQLVKKPDFNLNKFFYKQIGKKHRWIDRLSWNDQIWSNYITNNSVKTYIIKGYFLIILVIAILFVQGGMSLRLYLGTSSKIL